MDAVFAGFLGQVTAFVGVIPDLIAFLFVLSFLVVIHELGHYLSARFFKVRVEEFGVGYPPKAMTLFKRGQTAFTLNWIPFGGFVRMDGEEGSESVMVGLEDVPSSEIDDAVRSAKAPTKVKDKEGPFYEKSKFARLVITIAGAAVNFVFGILAFSIFFSLAGIPELRSSARIGEILPDSAAAQAKMPANVEIIAIELASGEILPVSDSSQVVEVIAPRPGQQVTLVTTGPCNEDGACQELAQRFPLTIQPKPDQPDAGMIGVRFTPTVIQRFYPWYEMPFRGAWAGLQQTLFVSQLIFDALGNIGQTLTRGAVPAEVGTPVKIFVDSQKAGIFRQGPLLLLSYAGIISVNLAIFNLLPIPALDGGRVVLILLEYLLGRERVSRIEGHVNYVGILALGSLMLILLTKDIFEVIFR